MESIVVSVAMFGWLPAVVLLFAVLGPVKGVVWGYLGSWLFLPMASYPIPGFPDYTKNAAASIGVLLGAAICGQASIARFRPMWVDLPMAVWCGVPILSAINNGFGAQEGVSTALSQLWVWGLPYLFGRIYLSSLAGFKELAVGVVTAAALYIPLCVVEMRLSPQLHRWIYGYHQHTFNQTLRGGAYRPMVFTQHGLALSLFMCLAGLICIRLWRSRSVKQIWGAPLGLVAAAITVTAVLCRSTGATFLLVIGCVSLFVTRATGSRALLVGLAILPSIYVCLRGIGGWSGAELVDAAQLISSDRAASLRVRLDSEAGVLALGRSHLLLGTSRFEYIDQRATEDSQRIIADSLWLIAMGKFGAVGLAALLFSAAGPLLLFLRRFRPAELALPALQPAMGLATAVALYMFDNLTNAMSNPIYMVMLGAIGGLRRGSVLVPRSVRRSSKATIDGHDRPIDAHEALGSQSGTT